MASIYVCSQRNPEHPRILELRHESILQKDIDRIQQQWPKGLIGIYFEAPLEQFPDPSKVDIVYESADDRVALYMMGIADKLKHLGQLSCAFQFYDLANAIHGNPYTTLAKARVLFDMGQLARAEQLLDDFLKFSPQEAEALYLKGRFKFSLNDYEGAKHYFKQAMQFLNQRNVENLNVKIPIKVFLEFTQLVLARDRLHTYNYTSVQYSKAITILKERSVELFTQVQNSKNQEIKGIGFSLEHLIKTFENWEYELRTL